MILATNNTGILDESALQPWSQTPHAEPIPTNAEDELTELVNDLVRSTDIDAFIRSTCLNYLARFGVTSWKGDCSAINFWCGECDATFRCYVSTNPLNRNHPPLCLLAVEMPQSGHTIYGSVVADLTSAGPLLLSHAVRSILLQALGRDD